MTSPWLPMRWLITTTDGSDDPDLFPLLIGQSFLVSRKPVFATQISTAISGRERRRKQWSYPKWAFKVSYEVISNEPSGSDLNRLTAFFLNHAGMYQEFFFLDMGANTVTAQPFGIGDGITTSFRLTRSFTFGGVTFTEPVGGLLGTPTVFVDGAPVTSFTVGDYGTLTFDTAPGATAALTWSGRYLFACRFDQDELDCQQMMDKLWSLDGLQFITVKA